MYYCNDNKLMINIKWLMEEILSTKYDIWTCNYKHFEKYGYVTC